MPNINSNGVRLEFKHETIELTLHVSIHRHNAWMAFVIFVCILVFLVSSFSQDTRDILLQILLWLLQTMLLGIPIKDQNP
jgi:hypothetical protein